VCGPYALSITMSVGFGLRVRTRRSRSRWKALWVSRARSLYGESETKVLTRRFNLSDAQEWVPQGSYYGVTRVADRAAGADSDVPTGDNRERQRSEHHGQGSTSSLKGARGVRILDAEKASV